ncbi:NEDD8-specific protease 1-like [Benincasa hispida]|uniref:NEDD8-specific protease 1-like n=1 Tax=Benincasa hispida TaxID=102211 RepID=UPI00190292B8|nr:NEDD8-specific protease 1-like [Benincasa hispida]
MEDPKFLTYKNVVLRRSDLQSLEDQNYLNDTVIDFYFVHLSVYYQYDEILLIPTSVSFLLANAIDLDSFTSTIKSLDLQKKKLIFFTVNNDNSHWSLFVYCRKRNLFMHYDSVNQVNCKLAFSIYESLNDYIIHDSAKFMECLAPKQRNWYDCGLYVMEISRVICECYSNVDRFRNEEKDGICESVDCNYVEFDMRSKLLGLILKMKNEEIKP